MSNIRKEEGEECKQSKNVDQQNKYFYKRTLVPMTLFLVFCISIATAIKGLQSNEVVAEKVLLEPDEVYSQYLLQEMGKQII